MKKRIIIYTTIFLLWYIWYYYLFEAWKNTYIDTSNLESKEIQEKIFNNTAWENLSKKMKEIIENNN